MPEDPNLLQILTTEHFVLQGARAAATGESSSRSGLYLTVLSATVVALSFASQVSGGRDLLGVFALIALPVAFFLGLVTYMRVLENGLEDFLYVKGMNRIRHAYTDIVPESARYFVLSVHDDGAGILRSMGLRPGRRWQRLFTSATLISVVNSIVAGVIVAVAVGGPGHLAAGLAGGLGAVVAVGIGAVFGVHQRRAWDRVGVDLEILFPSPELAPD